MIFENAMVFVKWDYGLWTCCCIWDSVFALFCVRHAGSAKRFAEGAVAPLVMELATVCELTVTRAKLACLT